MPTMTAGAVSSRAVLHKHLGVVVTSATIGLIEFIKSLDLTIPNPPSVLLLAVVFAAFRGGMAPGLLSAAIAWTYIAYHFSLPGQPFRFNEENSIRVPIWGITTPAMAVLVGVLHRRAVRLASEAERARAAEAIRRGEENTRLVIENALDAIITTDEHHLITGWNPQAERIFGRSRAKALRSSFVETVIAPERRAEYLQLITAFLHAGGRWPIRDRVETMAVRADGREFPIELSLCALTADGAHTVHAYVRDITDRIDAERRQRLMVKELDHRVKNNLAAVLSIADQTAARSDSIASFLANFRGRVMALARLHNSLAASHWTGADLHSLVTQTLEPYVQHADGRVVIRGTPVVLPAHAVSSVCMALHELATNAAKYGALSVLEGHVDIEWTREPGPDGISRLRVLWKETGGPPVKAPSRSGFGRELIEQGVPFEIGGRANLEFTAAGVVCELVVPLRADPPPPQVANAPVS